MGVLLCRTRTPPGSSSSSRELGKKRWCALCARVRMHRSRTQRDPVALSGRSGGLTNCGRKSATLSLVFHLPKTYGSAAAGVDQEFLVASFDQSTRPETIWSWCGRGGTDQRHLEIAVGAHFAGPKHARQQANKAHGKQ